MKGGGHNYRWDVRRTWRCPVCQAVRKTAGDVTATACSCGDRTTWMTLEDLPSQGFPNTGQALADAKATLETLATSRVEAGAKPASKSASQNDAKVSEKPEQKPAEASPVDESTSTKTED